ncbi:MAG: hypothetical protein AAGA93_00535 [Actinomycetota bacterium]
MIVFVTVLAAEADGTRQTVTFLIGCLVGIAGLLTVATVWYWFYTDPKRRPIEALEPVAEPLLDERPSGDSPLGRSMPASSPASPPESAAASPPDLPGVSPPDRPVVSPPDSPVTSPDRPVVSPPDSPVTSPALRTVSSESPAGPAYHQEPGPEPEPAVALEATITVDPVTGVGSGRIEPGPAAESGGDAAGPIAEPGPAPLLARQTWDFVVAAKRAEEVVGGDRTAPSPAPRIDVADRTTTGGEAEAGDELAVVRRRRERATERGLTDEAWRSAQRAAFKKLDG